MSDDQRRSVFFFASFLCDIRGLLFQSQFFEQKVAKVAKEGREGRKEEEEEEEEVTLGSKQSEASPRWTLRKRNVMQVR